MARSRMIRPEFFDDEKLGRVSRDARLLFIGMWKTSDDYGVTKGNLAWLRANIFPYDGDVTIEDMERWVGELEKIDCIRGFEAEDERYYWIRNFKKYQKLTDPSKQRNPEPPKILTIGHSPGVPTSKRGGIEDSGKNLTGELEGSGKNLTGEREGNGKNLTGELEGNRKKFAGEREILGETETETESETETETEGSVDVLIQKIKISFSETFNKFPYPTDKQKRYSEWDEILRRLVRRIGGNKIYLEDMKKYRGKKINSLLYFITSKFGASRWDKLADQYQLEEHERIKREFAIFANNSELAKSLVGAFGQKKKPDWIAGVEERYKRLVKQYEAAEGEMKIEIGREIEKILRRFGIVE